MKQNKLRPNLDFNKKHIFLTAASVLLVFNLYTLAKETINNHRLRQRYPYTFKGDWFRGIEKITQNAPYIGYYTDKSLDDNHAAMQFAQAQLILAPSILDLNNTNHEFIIFNCSSPVVALNKIKEIGAKALKGNQYGIIIAHNPNIVDTQKANMISIIDKNMSRQQP
ncbi:MAG: hypothetical protein H6754_07795 [Candidatus Omnitrophica bacterium]|nr:hypothetical protein [Candidatus Omnitrophota bacterium]